MNVGEMVERVYQEVGHKDRYYVLSLLNEAQSLLVWGAGGIEKTAYLSFVDGTADAPIDLITAVLLTDGDMSYNQDNLRNYKTGWDRSYTVFDGNVMIYPANDVELTLNYYGQAGELIEDTDTPDIDLASHYLLPMYAVAMAGAGDTKSTTNLRMSRFEQARAVFNITMARKRGRRRVREVNNW